MRRVEGGASSGRSSSTSYSAVAPASHAKVTPCNASPASRPASTPSTGATSRCCACKPGEIFEIETYDASTGYFKTPQDKAIPGRRPGFDRSPPQANPIGGPVFVEGAERGDTLVVTIEDIMVADYSWIAIGPRRGPLGESTRWPELSGDYTTKIFRHTPGPSGTHARRHPALQRPPVLADHAVHRHPGRRPRPRGDDQPRRPGRMGRQSRHPRRRRRQPHPAAGLSPGRPLLPRRRPRQPGRHRVHRHRRRDASDRAPEAGPHQGQAHALDARSRSRSRSCRSTPTGRWKWRSKRRRST